MKLVRDPVKQTDGIITVHIPRRLLEDNKALDFPLPKMLAKKIPANAKLRITTLKGHKMPSWLRYDRATKRFIASHVPKGGLPLKLVLSFAGKRWVVLVTEQTAK